MRLYRLELSFFMQSGYETRKKRLKINIWFINFFFICKTLNTHFYAIR